MAGTGGLSSLVDVLKGLQDLGFANTNQQLGVARQAGALGGFAQRMRGDTGPLLGGSNRSTRFFGNAPRFNLGTANPLNQSVFGGGGLGGGGSLEKLLELLIGQMAAQIGREERRAGVEEQTFFAPGMSGG